MFLRMHLKISCNAIVVAKVWQIEFAKSHLRYIVDRTSRNRDALSGLILQRRSE